MIKKITGLLLLLASSLTLAAPAAYVHEMTGTGSVTSKGQSRPLEVGGLLESGDVISVAKGGSTTVKFEDGQIVALQENSRFAIEKYEYNTKKVAESSAVMSLLSGSMRFITGVIGGTRKEAIAMKAGTATIGIRGTDVAITIAGVQYVVTVQAGGIVLSLPNQPTAAINQGQGAGGSTNQAVNAVPVITLSRDLLNTLTAVTAKELPGNQPGNPRASGALVKAVDDAKKLGEDAAKPGATAQQKADAAAAAQRVQQAIVAALQATQTAIQTALAAGAPQTAATGTGATAGTQPGVTPKPNNVSEVQQLVRTVNAALPSDITLNAGQVRQLELNILNPAKFTTTPLTGDRSEALEKLDTTIQNILSPPCSVSCSGV
jgi:hypothetical protein